MDEPAAWPAGEGEMARRIRAFDWAETPLGPMGGWSQGLRFAVELMLGMPAPATILWGPAFVQIYNDGYVAIAGDRHPRLLGLPVAEGWPEAHDEITRPLLATVQAGGSTKLKNLPARLRGAGGHIEERLFDVDCSPVRDHTGAVAGVLQIANEVTAIDERERAQAALRESEERRSFLLELSDALRAQSGAPGMIESAARLLGERLKASRVLFAEFDEARGIAEVFSGWSADGLPSFPTVMPLEDYRGPVVDDLLAGRAVRIDDTAAVPGRPDLVAVAELGVAALLSVPIVVRGRMVMNISLHQNTGRHWRDSEVALAAEVLERLWAEIVRMRAEASMRESEGRYRTLFETMGQGYCELELVRDSKGRAVDQLYLRFNPAFERIFGVPVAEAEGRLASTVFPELGSIWTETFDRIARSGVSEKIEQRFGERWFEVFAQPQGGTRLALLYDEITDRKQAERALRESEVSKAFLLQLSDTLRTEADPRSIAMTSVRLLADHMKLDRAYVAELDKRADRAEVGPEYRRADLAPVTGILTLSEFPEAFAQVEAETLVLHDTAADKRLSDLDKHSFAQLQMGALVVASARKGEQNPVWAMVVAMVQPRAWTAAEVSLVEQTAERTWAAMQRARAEAAVRESDERFREFGNASSGVLWMRDSGTLRWTYLSAGYEPIYGVPPEEALNGDTYRNWLKLVVPADRRRAVACMRQVRSGTRATFEYRIRRPSDGEVRWLRNTDFPIRNQAGKVVRIGGIGTDITALKAAEAHQATLLAELQHRVRNTLAVVRSIARRTAENSVTVDDMVGHLQGRLDAFSRVQAALTRSADAKVGLHALIEDELIAHAAQDGQQVAVQGPQIELSATTAERMSLAVHELTTNAVKHGALISERGKVEICWSIKTVEGESYLDLNWKETGVELPGRPIESSGFGMELLQRSLPYDLDAETSVELHPHGLEFNLLMPLKSN